MKTFDEFSAIDNITFGQIQQRLALTADDMGQELASFRAVPGWKGTAFVFLAPALVLSGLLVAPDATGRWIAVGAYFLLLLATGAFWVRGWLEKHRVCRHGLVLGLRRQYVVPWSTIDPGRVRLLRRANFVQRHGIAPGPLLRPGETLGHALLVNGLDDTPTGHERIAFNERFLREGEQPDKYLTCFDRWFLAGRHATSLVRAMEDAMVADGYPARGMADAVIARPVVVPFKHRQGPHDIPGEHLSPMRAMTDPVLGVAGHGTFPPSTD